MTPTPILGHSLVACEDASAWAASRGAPNWWCADSGAPLDQEIMNAGFHGYEGCPLRDPRSEGSCPMPCLCSKRGHCGAFDG